MTRDEHLAWAKARAHELTFHSDKMLCQFIADMMAWPGETPIVPYVYLMSRVQEAYRYRKSPFEFAVWIDKFI